MFTAIKLAKSGYFEGDPSKVLQAPCDIVMNILRYEAEEKEFNDCYRAINEVKK